MAGTASSGRVALDLGGRSDWTTCLSSSIGVFGLRLTVVVEVAVRGAASEAQVLFNPLLASCLLASIAQTRPEAKFRVKFASAPLFVLMAHSLLSKSTTELRGEPLYNSGTIQNLSFKKIFWGFSGDPVVRMQCFHCLGLGFDPWLQN